ncbi:hypothetical protein D9M68_928260 [compost metagenome]
MSSHLRRIPVPRLSGNDKQARLVAQHGKVFPFRSFMVKRQGILYCQVRAKIDRVCSYQADLTYRCDQRGRKRLLTMNVLVKAGYKLYYIGIVVVKVDRLGIPVFKYGKVIALVIGNAFGP